MGDAVPAHAGVPLYGAPRLPAKLIPRPELIERLHGAGALAIVRGPAGSGKTVLLADWARGRSSAAAGVWVTVDADVASRGGFWRAVLQTVLDAGAGVEEVLRDAISAIESPQQLRRELLRAFIRLEEGFALVLDSFELVSDPLVSEDLIWVLRHCEGLRLLVATRTLGVLERSLDAIALDPVVVTPEQLLLSAEETTGILRSAGVGSDPDLGEAVHDATGGNALAVRAAAMALHSDPSGFSAPSARQQLREALAAFLRRAMFDSDWESGLFAFVARTAVAEVLTVELAQRLSGADEAAALLDAAEEAGLGMWSLGRSGRVFRYTPVVRTAFIAELKERFPEERSGLWRTAAEWAARNGRWATAIALAVEIDDLALANRIAREPWFELDHHDNARIIEILGRLPRLKLRRYPLLLLMLALGYNAIGGHRLRSLETFGLAVAAVRLSTPADAAERLVLKVAETVALRISGHIERALPAAEEAMGLLDRLGAEGRDQLEVNLGVVLNQVGLTFFYAGRSEQAIRAFAASYSRPGHGRERSRFHAVALLCGAHAVGGDIVQARSFLEEARRLHWPDVWRNGYVGSMRRLAEAFLSLEEFDFDSAQMHVTAMRAHLGTIEHWPLFAHVQAMIELGRGHAVAGEAGLSAEMQRSGRPSITRFTRVRLDMTRALLLLAAGHSGRAAKLLQSHQGRSHPVAVMAARRELLAGHPEQAIRLLGESVMGQPVSFRSQADALLLKAAAALRLGKEETALSSLDQMAAIVRDRGVRFQLMLVPRSDLRALLLCSRRREGALASEILARLEEVPAVMPESLLKVQLSQREEVVLRQLVHTAGIAETAAALFVSPNTVKAQLRSIYRKLGANSREEALLVVAEHGLLSE